MITNEKKAMTTNPNRDDGLSYFDEFGSKKIFSWHRDQAKTCASHFLYFLEQCNTSCWILRGNIPAHLARGGAESCVPST